MAEYTAPERARAALLTIGAQRDCTLAGSPVHSASVGGVLPALRVVAEAFRTQGAPIVHAVRLYRPDGTNVDLCRREAVEEGLRVLMPGSLGAELVDPLKPAPDVRLDPPLLLDGQFQELAAREWALYKPRWGAFYGTGLEAHLRDLGVTTLVICGCNFRTAVRATIFEASARDFRIVVVPDAISGATEDGLAELGRMGVYLVNSDCCAAWLTGRGRPTVAA